MKGDICPSCRKPGADHHAVVGARDYGWWHQQCWLALMRGVVEKAEAEGTIEIERHPTDPSLDKIRVKTT